MEDKISKGGNYKRFKKGSKREHGNFVHPPFEISGSAPDHVSWLCLQQVGNVLSFAGRDRGLGELWNT